MPDPRCVHDMLPGYCADCAPLREGLPEFVTVVRYGRLFHRNADCPVFTRPRENAKQVQQPIRVRSRAAEAEGYQACWDCFPGIGLHYTVDPDYYVR